MFRVTYEIVTPESAEHGEAESHGFVNDWGCRIPIDEAMQSQESFEMSLRDAMQFCYPQEDSGSWWSECDGRENYQTGASERRSLHPPRNITASSYRRVSRLLNL